MLSILSFDSPGCGAEFVLLGFLIHADFEVSTSNCLNFLESFFGLVEVFFFPGLFFFLFEIFLLSFFFLVEDLAASGEKEGFFLLFFGEGWWGTVKLLGKMPVCEVLVFVPYHHPLSVVLTSVKISPTLKSISYWSSDL